MSHIELITRIRAHLHDGDHLDAWELALEAQDAVAIAYVEAHAPITIKPEGECPECEGSGELVKTVIVNIGGADMVLVPEDRADPCWWCAGDGSSPTHTVMVGATIAAEVIAAPSDLRCYLEWRASVIESPLVGSWPTHANLWSHLRNAWHKWLGTDYGDNDPCVVVFHAEGHDELWDERRAEESDRIPF